MFSSSPPLASLLNLTAGHSGMELVIAAIIGLLLGSFLNVVIHRLPLMIERDIANYLAQETGQVLPHTDRFNLLTPRSACPHCGTPIAAWHNIPVLSYLMLGGRCIHCKTRISWRYPAVELLSAILSVLMVVHFGLGIKGIAAILLVYFLIVLSFIDARTQLLPDSLTLSLLWLGLIVNLYGLFVPLQDAVIGAAGGYLTLWTIYWIHRLISGREGIGFGDFKLFSALGAWLGWQVLPPLLLLASGVAAVIGIALLLTGRHARHQTLPFGPYLALAGGLILMYGPDCWTLLLPELHR